MDPRKPKSRGYITTDFAEACAVAQTTFITGLLAPAPLNPIAGQVHSSRLKQMNRGAITARAEYQSTS